ncbi:MAG: UvrD-helicase domain-containing protein [Bacteroidota bacterium]
MVEFLNELNEAQREAALAVDGPVMVIAGAGSGKTRVLTYRLAFIISQGLADPQELLSLTFTNKAAKEMKNRIFKLVGADAKSIQMGTFHSIFSRILRVEAEKLGYTSSYTIYDSNDSQGLIKAILKERKLDDKVYKPRVVSNTISSAKNRLIGPKELKEMAIDDFNAKVAELYGIYEERCFRANAMDFDDLLIKPIKLFKTQPDLLHKYQHRFQYLMVDEYQDTNHAQYLLTKMLAAVHENICVVGDDAQSIYGFRGADISNILNFQKDYPETKIIKLERNYRSTKNIVLTANSIIARNQGQIPKKIYTENEAGSLIKVIETSSEQQEALKVCEMIREQKQMQAFFNKDFAVLYRTNAQSRAIEDALRRAGIKYQIYGGLSFYQRKEIKDTVAYLRLAINLRDEQALVRVINYPTRGVGKTSLERLIVFADQERISLWEAMKNVKEAGVRGKAVNAIQDFCTMIESFQVLTKQKNAFEMANYIVKQSGILKTLHTENTLEGLGRFENVQELINAAQEFSQNPDLDDHSLESFLADISLFTDQDKSTDDDDRVTLMTIHSAKGLEFKSVFLVGMEENLFPSSMSIETRMDLEEERRLFYVAITRAEKILTLSHAKSRFRFGNIQYNEASRFLDELDEQYIQRTSSFAARKTASDKTFSTGRRSVVQRRTASRRGSSVPNNPDFKAADPGEIHPGLEVLHQKFGQGKVMAVEGDGPDKKATVFFQQKGQRVLLLKFAKLQII